MGEDEESFQTTIKFCKQLRGLGVRGITPLIVTPYPGTDMYDFCEKFGFLVYPDDKDVLATSDMVSGADIIVEFGSSIGIAGAYQNVPAVSLGLEVLFGRLKQESGSRVLDVAEDGLSELVPANAAELASKINKLLAPAGFARMRACQEKLCPKPTERGAALRKIADAIARI